MRLSRRGDIPAFVVMEMSKAAFEMQRAGRQVFHMEVGQPATRAPALARAAAARALDEDLLAYTDANGTPALRRRVAKFYADRYGVEIDPERVIATTGSSAGFVLTFLAAVGIVTRAQLLGAWRYAVVLIMVFSAIATPTTDPATMSFLAAPMIVLYLLSVFLAGLVERPRARLAAGG